MNYIEDLVKRYNLIENPKKFDPKKLLLTNYFSKSSSGIEFSTPENLDTYAKEFDMIGYLNSLEGELSYSMNN